MRRASWVLTLIAVCTIIATAPAQAQTLRARLYSDGFAAPLGFEQDPADPRVQFVVQHGGIIRVIVDGVLQATPFLDLSALVLVGSETGLLGLAFPPDTATTRRFYVHFNTHTVLPDGTTIVSRVSRFTRSAANPLVADPESRFDFVWPTGEPFIRQIFSNHKGGQIAFGPDGYLYVGLGDGGSANDPGHFAQNPQSFLGKILRLDVSVGDGDAQGYDVPPDNPFVDGIPVSGRTEIWAIGLRNPWRFSFDRPALGGTGALIIGDVGQSNLEEIDYEPANQGGRNYGWRNYEGTRPNVDRLPLAYTPKTDPIFEYGRNDGGAVTGGFVYRGTEMGPEFWGRYFYADFISGRVWSLGLSVDPMTGEAAVTDKVEHTAELSATQSLGAISSFGRDASGELYIVSYGGEIFRLGRAPLERPVLTEPISGRAGLRPTYRWRPVTGATAYELWVNDSTGTRIDQWYNAAMLACTTTCSVQPDTTLAEGNITWWVRGWNAEQGNGPWSSGATVLRAGPPAATLVYPSGGIPEARPPFNWRMVPEATHYYLWVNDSSGHVLDAWYSSASANCSVTSGACTVQPGVFVSGQGMWWIQTWNATHGYGAWSPGRAFSRPLPGTPRLIAPNGAIATATPQYSWNAVAGATHYYLWVNDSSGTRIQTWYGMAQVGCGAAGTTCSITPATALAAGNATWWVQAWSADRGYSAWSAGMMFSR